MRPDAVLVLGSEENKLLREKLFEAGLTAIVRSTMHDALRRLRHGGFVGIIVDWKNVSCDVLEFVLNVRDFHADIPVFVLDCAVTGRGRQALLGDKATFLIKNVAEACAAIEELSGAGGSMAQTEGAGR